MGELSAWSSQGVPPPSQRSHRPPSSPDFCFTAPSRCEPSISTFRGTQRCPSSARSSLFWCCQLVIYCLNEASAHTHKHHFQEGDCVHKKKKKKEKKREDTEKINACSGEHSRSSVDGRCLKRWQLSRDSDCLVGFLLHFRTEVAAFVVGATLQCIIHILRRCALHRCYCSTASGTVFPPVLASDPCVIGFVKNKGGVWLKAISFVVLFPPFVSHVLSPPHTIVADSITSPHLQEA